MPNTETYSNHHDGNGSWERRLDSLLSGLEGKRDPNGWLDVKETLMKFGHELIAASNERKGVLSNMEIRQGLLSEHIIIHPFDSENLNTTSYDVTLGEFFYRTDRSSHNMVFNPFDRTDVGRYFGTEERQAIPHKDYIREHRIDKFEGIPLDHPIIVLAPGERILAHTHEFIGINPPGTSSMQARSTWGRIGIQVCEDAGWGDSGYINRWTMEIHNGNENVHVPLPVGERIAQIVFYHTGEVDGDYSHMTGKYQRPSKNLRSLIEKWKPADMLPRAYKDKRKRPLPL